MHWSRLCCDKVRTESKDALLHLDTRGIVGPWHGVDEEWIRRCEQRLRQRELHRCHWPLQLTVHQLMHRRARHHLDGFGILERWLRSTGGGIFPGDRLERPLR